MGKYVQYPLHYAGGGATPWGDITGAASSLGGAAIESLEGDYPTALGGAGKGALSGAAAGTAIMPGIGTAVGALVGGISGFFQGKAKAKQAQTQRDTALQQKQEMQFAGKLANSQRGLTGFPINGTAYSPFLMADGGYTPAKPGTPIAQGASFTQNWAKKRAQSGFMGLTPEDATGISTPSALSRPQMNATYNATAGNAILKPGESIYGYYSPGADRAQIATDIPRADQRTSAAHETTHDWQNTLEYNYGTNGSQLLDKAKGVLGMQQSPLRQSYANLDAEIQRSGKKPNSYYGNPAEIHANIMGSRDALGLTPEIPVTQQHIEQLKKKSPWLYQTLSQSLDDKGMINGFNKTVMNSPVSTGQVYAAKGGLLAAPLYKAEAGEVIDHQPGDVPLTDDNGSTTKLSNQSRLITGDKHSAQSGGVGMSSQAPARIFSDQLKPSPALLKRLSHY